MNIWGFRCFHCQATLSIPSHGICSRCYRELRQTPYCGHCGASLPNYSLTCGNCLRNEPKWHRIVQISDYKPPLADWIHRFKFQQQDYLDQMLSRLLLLAIRNAQREHFLRLPEVIIPVPLFWQRHWMRGYNQAELLARKLSELLAIPLDTKSLQRTKATKPQRELTAQERRRNLRGAFIYQSNTAYKHIAIVDDVVTTGSTMNVICTELLKHGVEEIQVWTLARA
ncbi:phosphoribosyltransferase family protein [Glaesserella sp.]|uniref:phosphoribosyltransferase family protein n=1 Tax=Glaesserella sp. TaxID=2094731 RepID=UPI0035A1B02E